MNRLLLCIVLLVSAIMLISACGDNQQASSTTEKQQPKIQNDKAVLGSSMDTFVIAYGEGQPFDHGISFQDNIMTVVSYEENKRVNNIKIDLTKEFQMASAISGSIPQVKYPYKNLKDIESIVSILLTSDAKLVSCSCFQGKDIISDKQMYLLYESEWLAKDYPLASRNKNMYGDEKNPKAITVIINKNANGFKEVTLDTSSFNWENRKDDMVANWNEINPETF
jgi:hypothetical protein